MNLTNLPRTLRLTEGIANGGKSREKVQMTFVTTGLPDKEEE